MSDLKNYLATRRSTLSVALEAPGPDAGEIKEIVTIASRVPDHGKLSPWRFELWSMNARRKMHGDLLALLDQDEQDRSKERAGTDKLLHAPTVIAVISTASDHPKIPIWEQHLSTGAACMNTLLAANACGYEAQWLTAWYVYDKRADGILALNRGEKIAGIIHIGKSHAAKSERDRPPLTDIFSVREN